MRHIADIVSLYCRAAAIIFVQRLCQAGTSKHFPLILCSITGLLVFPYLVPIELRKQA